MEQQIKSTPQTSQVARRVVHNEHRVKYHNVIISLLSLLVLPTYLYGVRIFFLLTAGLITAFVCEIIYRIIIKRDLKMKYDYSGVVTALVAVMLMPATVPVFVICVSVMFGVCVAKYPFGGVGHNIFNPAAVGVAFSALCWPDLVMKYPVPYTTYDVANSGVQMGSSLASALRVGGTPKIDYFDILLGRFPGPIGATCVIVLVTCALYLLFRKVISKRVVFSALFVVAACAALFPRILTGKLDSLVYELSSGALLFAIIFMSGDPTTIPKESSGKVFYGALLGLFIVLFRYFGKMELAEVYAILLANVFAGSCDRYANHLSRRFGKGARAAKRLARVETAAKDGESQ